MNDEKVDNTEERLDRIEKQLENKEDVKKSKESSMSTPSAGFFQPVGRDNSSGGKSPISEKYDQITKRSPKNEAEKTLADFNDRALIATSLIKGFEKPTRRQVREVIKEVPRLRKFYKENLMRKDSEINKAMDTQTAGEGLEWIPTDYTEELFEQVRRQRFLTDLPTRHTMDEKRVNRDQLTQEFTSFRAPESLDDDGTDISTSELGTSDVLFEARKLAAATIVSEESLQDIVNFAGVIREKMPEAIADGEENALINGRRISNAADHPDGDVTNDMDSQTMFDGLRQMTMGNDFTDGSFTTDLSGNNFTLDQIDSMLSDLGRYWQDPSELVWITSGSGFHKLRTLTNEDNQRVVQPIEGNENDHEGAIAKLQGVDIVISEYVKNELDANGIRPQTPGNHTQLLLWHIPSTEFGDREQLSVREDEKILSDQRIVVGKERIDFKQVVPAREPSSENHVVIGNGLELL